ncbi:MAG: LysR family transcriptional regulator [Firmicutes bacterium]|nr:LysR family transcriptional regulator [Bacillota bacterium]
MNFKQLEAFVKVAELESFTRAARQLYMSQPAVSFQIKALEEALKVILFRRDEKKIILTDAGRLLYPEAKQLLGHYGKIRAGLDALRGLESGQLSIGAGTIPGEYLLPACIGVFRDKYPGVKAKLRIAGSGEVVRWVLEREIDLGVAGNAAREDSLEHIPWLDDELVLIVPPGHRLSGKKTDVTGLAGEKCVLREEGSGTRSSIEKILSGHGFALDNLDVEMELGSTRAVIGAVQAGLGIGFVSRWSAEEALGAGKLGEASLNGVDMKRTLFLVRYRSEINSHAAAAFFNFLREISIKQIKERLVASASLGGLD